MPPCVVATQATPLAADARRRRVSVRQHSNDAPSLLSSYPLRDGARRVGRKARRGAVLSSRMSAHALVLFALCLSPSPSARHRPQRVSCSLAGMARRHLRHLDHPRRSSASTSPPSLPSSWPTSSSLPPFVTLLFRSLALLRHCGKRHAALSLRPSRIALLSGGCLKPRGCIHRVYH